MPPLTPVVIVLITCAYVFFLQATTLGISRGGIPYTAHYRAAQTLTVFSPVVYLLFVFVNLIDASFDKRSATAQCISTLLIVIIFGTLLSWIFERPEVDLVSFFGVTSGFGVAIALIIPMTVARRFTHLS